MTSPFAFLVHLSKLCQQELSKRACVEGERVTEDLSPARCNGLTSPTDCSNRSTKRCETSTEEKHFISEEDSFAPEDPPQPVILKKEDSESLFAARLRCPNCSYVATSFPERYTHVSLCTKVEQDGCPLCFEGAGLGKLEVDDHIKSVHLNSGELQRLDNGSYHCKKCDKVFKYFAKMKIHISTLKHQDMDRCKLCGIVLSWQNMAAHQKEFHGRVGNSFICPVCAMLFASRMSVDRHIRNVHTIGKQQFKCQYCDMTHYRKDNLRKHERTHAGERRFTCSVCDLTFKTKDNLQNHVTNIHLKEDRYQCRFCYRSFDDESRRDIHVKMVHEKSQLACQICGKTFIHYCKKEKHLQAHLNAFKNEKDKRNIPKERRDVKKESRAVEFDSSAEENKNIYKRRKNTKKESCFPEEFDSSAEEDENVYKRRKITKEESFVGFDSSAEEDENVYKRRKITKEESFAVGFDSSAEEDENVYKRRKITKEESCGKNTNKKREGTKKVSQSDVGVKSLAEKEMRTSLSVNEVGENVDPDKTDSRKKDGTARVASSRNRKRKGNCENRSPNLSEVTWIKKQCSDAPPSEADCYSKGCLSIKDPNVLMSESGGDELSVARRSKCGRMSRPKSKTYNVKDEDCETANVLESAPFVGELNPAKPALTIPEDTLFLYVNSPNGESIDSFSSLRPESVSESTLFIDVDNIPECDGINIIDLTSADFCPVEVEYLSIEDAHGLASGNYAEVDLSQPIKVEVDSGISLASVDELPRRKAPAKKKSTPVPRRNRKKYPDLGRKVIVKNLYSNDDTFILPEFVIDEDDD